MADAYASSGHSTGERIRFQKRPRPNGVALPSILHELLTTEFDLAVWKTIENRGDLARLFVERRLLPARQATRFSSTHGRVHRVVPDSGFLLQTEDANVQTSGRLPSPAVALPRTGQRHHAAPSHPRQASDV